MYAEIDRSRQARRCGAAISSLACLWLAACGDDGSEQLSTCPGGRIETDAMGVIRCAEAPEEARARRAAGAATPSASSATTRPAAASGEAEVPARDEAGAGANERWYCAQVMSACSCVTGSIENDTCSTPRPTCCAMVENESMYETCVCYPEGSAECTSVESEPALFTRVPRCPP